MKKRERQMSAIEAGADALGYARKKIPLAGKNEIRTWCKENHSNLFGAGDDPFKEAWQEASKANRIIIENRDRFRRKPM
ncbi:hypothetical protein [Burkholderia pseudomallei]|uniref:hypothetical protein n=1 Tax=Burkholderia pseudomallei TaxID=28450 RepID=UPI0011C2367D|nr:hypothetical protein [Burkholderia pseudomallei]